MILPASSCSDIIAQNTQEYIFIICMIRINIIVSAYILGTITILVVKADEKQQEFRAHTKNLTRYSIKKSIPIGLRQSMKDHLALYLDHHEVRDETVLSIYPATIRRRVLRHCYLDLLNRCHLLKNTTHKFKDVLLTAARIETFLPNDEIVQIGDFSQDICIIVGGAAVLRSANFSDNLSMASDEDKNERVGPLNKVQVKVLMPGDSFGETCECCEIFAFFLVSSLITLTFSLSFLHRAYEPGKRCGHEGHTSALDLKISMEHDLS